MQKVRSTVTWFLLLSLVILARCATMPGPDGQCYWSSPAACIAANTAGGAAIGALVGAGIGALSRGKNSVATGAIAGGVAGGVMAFAISWGKCWACFTKVKSETLKDYEQTRNESGYSPEQGTLVKISKGLILTPSAVAPGGTVILKGNYLIMFPPDKKEMSVSEVVILKAYNPDKKVFEETGRTNPEAVVVAPGERKADSEIPIPDSENAVGRYLISFMVTADGKSDIIELPLTITKDKDILEKAKGTPSMAGIQQSSYSGDKSLDKKQYVSIITSKAALRDKPDTKGKVIGSAVRNEKYQYVGSMLVAGKKWYQIRLNDTDTAWVLGNLARIVEK